MTEKNAFTCGNITVSPMVIGPIQTNVYVVSNKQGTFVVDPAEDCDRILKAVSATHTGMLDAIVVTHAHFDHTGALAQLRSATGACVIASVFDAPSIENPHKEASSPLPAVEKCSVDRRVNNDDILELCGMHWQVLLTPGHTKGSMCLYLPASESGGDHGILLSGDTLFKGTCGRTDFESGSASDMCESLKRLQTLPNNTLVLPGHMQFTEIGAEQHSVFARIG